MITCYFGVPGVGKSTLLTKIAVKELKRIRKGKSKYDAVYSNFFIKGVNKLSFADLNSYKLNNALILLDELTVDADNRHFKSFPDGIRDFFIYHRHLGCDIVYATQNYALVDVKIRALTYDLWYMTRSPLKLLGQFTFARRIYRQININEQNSELSIGYRFCNIIERFVSHNNLTVFRPLYYKYFDSFDESVLASRPVPPASVWGYEVIPSDKVESNYIDVG